MYLEVYPDIIFILNLVFDIILLYILKKVSRKGCKKVRIILAAIVGGGLAVIAGVFPWLPILIKFLLLYVVGALLMIIIAFSPLKPMEVIKLFIALNCITYFVGGLINSVYYNTNMRMMMMNLGNIIFSNISLITITVVMVIMIPAVLLVLRVYHWFVSDAPETYEVELCLEKRRLVTRGLMDTGNCLYDPICRKPVMVIERALMGELLTEEFVVELEKAKSYLDSNNLDTGQWLLDPDTVVRLKFIPYTSVGKSGMLLGIKLDKVYIRTGKETICNEKVVAAFCDNQVSTKGNYHVILHKGLM